MQGSGTTTRCSRDCVTDGHAQCGLAKNRTLIGCLFQVSLRSFLTCSACGERHTFPDEHIFIVPLDLPFQEATSEPVLLEHLVDNFLQSTPQTGYRCRNLDCPSEVGRAPSSPCNPCLSVSDSEDSADSDLDGTHSVRGEDHSEELGMPATSHEPNGCDSCGERRYAFVSSPPYLLLQIHRSTGGKKKLNA